MIAPPFVVTQDQIHEIARILDRTLTALGL
jgi:adenosylmethionine-8-amino-7-oxononanoate aminotransferase